MNLDALRQAQEEARRAGARLVAVSKYHTVDEIREAYDAGQRVFGENLVQELVTKHEAGLPDDIEWHMIGHLQRNKVKYVVPFVSMIQSVDSLRLLQEIDKQAEKAGRDSVDCLLELHVAQEETKYGLTPDALTELLEETRDSLHHVRIRGLMAMATYTDDTEQVRDEFRRAKDIFIKVKKQFFDDDDAFCELSMGMSHDYEVALKEGATLIRVGTKIFGERRRK